MVTYPEIAQTYWGCDDGKAYEILMAAPPVASGLGPEISPPNRATGRLNSPLLVSSEDQLYLLGSAQTLGFGEAVRGAPPLARALTLLSLSDKPLSVALALSNDRFRLSDGTDLPEPNPTPSSPTSSPAPAPSSSGAIQHRSVKLAPFETISLPLRALTNGVGESSGTLRLTFGGKAMEIRLTSKVTPKPATLELTISGAGLAPIQVVSPQQVTAVLGSMKQGAILDRNLILRNTGDLPLHLAPAGLPPRWKSLSSQPVSIGPRSSSVWKVSVEGVIPGDFDAHIPFRPTGPSSDSRAIDLGISWTVTR